MWVVLPVVMMAVLGLAVLGVYQMHQFRSELDRGAFELAQAGQADWKNNVFELTQVLRDRAGMLAEDPSLLKAWRDHDIPALAALAEARFAALKQQDDITHLNFITPDRICEFRAHRPAKRGGHIDRFTCFEAQRTGQDVWGIELGVRSELTLRYVKPCRVDGRLLGYLEIGMEIQRVADALAEKLDADVTIAISKDYTSPEMYAAGRQEFGFAGRWQDQPLFVITSRREYSFPTELKWRLDASVVPASADAVFVTKMEGERFACVVAPLTDAGGRDVARVVIVRNITAEANAAWRSLVLAHAVATVLAMVTIAMLWRATGKAEQQLAGAFTALRRNEQRLAATLRSIGDGVISTDAEGNVTSLNKVAEKLTGWNDMEARGRPISDVFCILNPATGENAPNPVWKTLGEDRAVTPADGAVLISRDGSECRIADSCSPIHDRDEKTIGAVLVFRDVSTEYRQREALRAGEEKYRALVENANDIIYTVSDAGVFTYLSPNWEWLLGYEAGEAEGKSFRLYVHPEDVELCDAFLKTVMDTGLPQSGVEYRVRHKDGHWCWHRSNGSALRDASGRVAGYIGVARDITEQKEAEAAIRQSKEELEQHVVALRAANLALEKLHGVAEAANRSKSDFLANMSHEIRTPITAILGYADVLLDECNCPTSRERIAVIKRNGEHLLGLINDILDLSKIEAGKMETQRVRCSPGSLLSEVISLMRVRAEAKGLELQLDGTGSIPETIQTDPLRLRQILVNLVGNAIKFTERGKIRVSANLNRDRSGRKLAFRVRDTGIGMSAQQIGGLFRPFSQADTSAARRFGGTGLGLAISRRLAQALGGDVEVQSTLAKGSTFTVTIDPGPLDGVRIVSQSSAAPALEEPSPSTAADTEIALPVRLLLAEDGPDNRRLIVLLLEKAGADITAVEDGQHALEVALAARHAGAPFDLILMDMQMPVMDGYTATQLLRELGYKSPIVALTANAMADDRQKCLDAGCNDYLSKPITRRHLLDMVLKWTANTVAGHA